MTPSRPNARPLASSRVLLFAVLVTGACAADTHLDILYDITVWQPYVGCSVAVCGLERVEACRGNTACEMQDEQYYEMPALFGLEDYEACVGRGEVYCLGSFELEPYAPSSLFQMMQRYSANWVHHFNHTRLHRGVCVSKSCDRFAPRPQLQPPSHTSLQEWFSECVNATTSAAYNLSARLYKLEYCHSGPSMNAAAGEPLSASEYAFAALVAALLALAALSTVLDCTLSAHAKKGVLWALAWSVPGCWRALTAPPPASADTDLRAFDGLRVLCMFFVIIEHVCWLTTQAYLADTRRTEMIRTAIDVVLMANSTLVVQIFFMMSSFLLAHKLLSMRRRGLRPPFVRTFLDTMFNRIIRISPSYFLVVWFAGSWWGRLGRGPVWAPLVGAETAVCQRKWWTHLLYLNNVLYADDKCLIQTWYLAADMQLYALALLLTLAMWRVRRGALFALAALLVASVAVLFGLAYHWRLVPTLVMHSPELVRATYKGESSFNVLYQSPLSNAPGALAGLLLAHLHHHLLDKHISLQDYKMFRWISVASVPVALWWVAASPLMLGRGPPGRGAAAALAALERPIFALFVSLALLGAMQGVKSHMRTFLSWEGWRVFARLSFGALLLHMPINKSLVAARLGLQQIDRQTAIIEWFGVCAVSYLAALPLALVVEIPAMRLHRALTSTRKATTNDNIAAVTPQKDGNKSTQD